MGAYSSWRALALVAAVVVGSLGAADGQGLRGQEEQAHVPARSAADAAMDAADKTRIRCDVLDSDGASAGHFTLELVRSWSPKGVERMLELVKMRCGSERGTRRLAPPRAASRHRSRLAPPPPPDSRRSTARYYDGAVFFRALKNFVVQWGMRSKEEDKAWAAQFDRASVDAVSSRLKDEKLATGLSNSRGESLSGGRGDA